MWSVWGQLGARRLRARPSARHKLSLKITWSSSQHLPTGTRLTFHHTTSPCIHVHGSPLPSVWGEDLTQAGPPPKQGSHPHPRLPRVSCPGCLPLCPLSTYFLFPCSLWVEMQPWEGSPEPTRVRAGPGQVGPTLGSWPVSDLLVVPPAGPHLSG